MTNRYQGESTHHEVLSCAEASQLTTTTIPWVCIIKFNAKIVKIAPLICNCPIYVPIEGKRLITCFKNIK